MSGAATVVSAWSPFIVYIAKRSLKTSHLKESERQGADFEACAPGELLPGHARSSMLALPGRSTVASVEHSSSQD